MDFDRLKLIRELDEALTSSTATGEKFDHIIVIYEQ